MTEITTLSPQQAEARESVVGSSEAAALYGLSPYLSKRELFERKIGRLEDGTAYSEVMEYGSRLEPVIAQWVADLMGWTVQKVHRPARHKRCEGWGASLDYEIIKNERGPGVLECKAVVWTADKWTGEDGDAEAPPHIEIQVQHQAKAVGRSWGAIGTMIGAGRPPKVILRNADDEFERVHIEVIEEFWHRIKRDDPYPFDPEQDDKLVRKLFPRSAPGKLLDLAALGQEKTRRLFDLAGKRCALKERVKALEKEITAAETEICAELGDAEGVTLPCPEGGNPYKVSWKSQERAEYLVKATAFRVLRITEDKPKGRR